MDKLKMHSPNLAEANIEKLAQLFPNCVTEAADSKGGLKRSSTSICCVRSFPSMSSRGRRSVIS